MDRLAENPFVQLIDRLGELEVTIGEQARPLVGELRERLLEAAAARERGDLPGALGLIRQSMERLAGLASRLDANEGELMRVIAESFTHALGSGDKGTAKAAVGVMRKKAGDDSKDPDRDW